MKKLILTIFLMSGTWSIANAETVRIYTDYSPVRILKLQKNADFEVEASKAGLSGNFKEVDESAIPKDRADRNFWKWNKGALNVDAVKKQAFLDARAQKESDKASAIGKLKATGLTDSELSALGIGG